MVGYGARIQESKWAKYTKICLFRPEIEGSAAEPDHANGSTWP
jgi:hypothetical protein